ncbi:MAG: DNA adenine methylase [Caldisphaera sp.]
MKSPITWFGGKSHLVKKLLDYVPKHQYYLELFGGGGSLLLAKEPSDFEVYNDIDEGLFNFWKVIHNEITFNKFYEKAQLTYHSRAIYDYARANWQQQTDEVEKAYLWWILAKMGFGGRFGTGSSWGYAITKNNATKALINTINYLPEIHKRLQKAQIDKKDWKECVKTYTENTKWNYENSFIYMDPPYIESTRRSGKYKHELTENGHEELIDYLIQNQNRNKFMLSGYDNEIYQQLTQNGWKKICWDVACHAVGRTKASGIQGEGATYKHNQRRQECIWINY